MKSARFITRIAVLVNTLENKQRYKEAAYLSSIVRSLVRCAQEEAIQINDFVIPDPDNWKFTGALADTTMILGVVQDIQHSTMGDDYIVQWYVGTHDGGVQQNSADELRKVSPEWVKHYEEFLRARKPQPSYKPSPRREPPQRSKHRRLWQRRRMQNK